MSRGGSIMQRCARPECGRAFRVEASAIGQRTYCSRYCAKVEAGPRPPACPACGDTTTFNGYTTAGVRRWHCPWCGAGGKVE